MELLDALSDLIQDLTPQESDTLSSSDDAERLLASLPYDDPADWDPSDDDEYGEEPYPGEAYKEWQRQRCEDHDLFSKYTERVMHMHGLEAIKRHFLEVRIRQETCARQELSQAGERWSTLFVGGPGTGKSTAARTYAKYLAELGLLGKSIVQVSARQLLSSRSNHQVDTLVKEACGGWGGAVIIDDAHHLSKSTDILDHIVYLIEEHIYKVIWIFTGYDKEMDFFFAHDPSMRSKVPYTIPFPDYTEDELLRIMVSLIRTRYRGRMNVEGGFDGTHMRAFIRRIARQRGSGTFSNVRTLQNELVKVSHRQALRLHEERKVTDSDADDWMLKPSDLMNSERVLTLEEIPAWYELQRMIGLTKVKEEIQAIMAGAIDSHERELRGGKRTEISLNKCFLGPPGTGKTTVARLYTQIIASLGLLSSGEVIYKTAADFIGAFLGSSEQRTKSILQSAVGKCLVIDEAYMFGPVRSHSSEQDTFRTAVVDTLVSEISNAPGEDRCVILIGYTDKIRSMFASVNPGLERRFPDSFTFETYAVDELRRILDCKLKDAEMDATPQAKEVASKHLARERHRPNFGNGGAVDNILNHAKLNHQVRVSRLPASYRPLDIIFEPADFDPDFDREKRSSQSFDELFADVVGCETVVERLRTIRDTIRGMQIRGVDPRSDGAETPFTYVFKGQPGTGKTTTARKMGRFFYELGLLATPDVIECSASDMVGQYVGQTGPKVVALLERAIGKVLFIDEAYRLGSGGSYATEAVDELVDALSKERFKQKLIVILAGYEDDMDHLMSVNHGLESRFPEELIFEPFRPEQCLELLRKELGKLNIRIKSPDADEDKENAEPHSSSKKPKASALESLFAQCAQLPNWGNARDVQNLAKKLSQHVFSAVARNQESFSSPTSFGSAESQSTTETETLSIKVAEVVAQLGKMLNGKQKRTPKTGSGRETTMTPTPPPHGYTHGHGYMYGPAPPFYGAPFASLGVPTWKVANAQYLEYMVPEARE
ncbi:P-loop containing nucleoside triphosphate hydrolase protein [Clohesyomyces aquaticus]|uniref:p-loop containing nucleoside triphosphate hydrolase protein n=1 Tax=Clohesyomyces aquaticus TaxID=1231657 RepID=A0A1Y1ZYS2_9PLEO|nr:P-loop containing nucleoside triphosphate hydrolase protein [Clohesyomyces aquaticus]